jgi:hypothetical protein
MLRIAFAVGLATALVLPVQAQQISATTQSTIKIPRSELFNKGPTPAALKRQLKEELQIKVVKNLLEASFAVKMTPQVEAKLPELVELVSGNIEYSYDPSDGEVLSGRARITVESAKLKEYLTNKGIGAGDIATKSAKILVSIDEFIGIATTNDRNTATETEIHYSHDKSSFSDTSGKLNASRSSQVASARTSNKDVAYAAKESSAVAGRQSSSFAGREDVAVAGRRDSGSSSYGPGGAYSGGSSSQYAGSSRTQVAGAQSSAYSAANSSQVAFADRSKSSSAYAAKSSESVNIDQKNIQQQNDMVSYSVRSKMPEFNNAKPLGASDQVLTSRLSGEFQNNGLRLVAENDLRAEGGRILPIWEITNNGRIDQFVNLIQRKNIEADVWATGTANYTIVGTTPTGTQCNGNLSVQGRFIDGNEVFFTDSLQAAAVGNGDQDCRARLGISLATSLAKILGERANKELNARNSRGSVYTLYLYSNSSLGRADRNRFQTTLKKTEGLQSSEPRLSDNFMAVSVQLAGSLDATINKVLDDLNWEKADYVSRPGNRICIGLEGKSSCPLDLR